MYCGAVNQLAELQKDVEIRGKIHLLEKYKGFPQIKLR